MLKKIFVGVLGAATAVIVGLLSLGNLMADKLSRPETVKRVISADEPCREAYAKVLDLQDRRDAGAAKASSDGEPLCRSAYEALDKINIFVPRQDLTDERLKRDTIKACARLSRVRADLLAQYASPRPDDAKLAALNGELATADTACQNQFKLLAGRA